jgi:hypothetical protein
MDGARSAPFIENCEAVSDKINYVRYSGGFGGEGEG